MPEALATFHLLRPLWLLVLVPVVAIVWLVAWRSRTDAQWRGVIAPHLLKHLVVKPPGGFRIAPIYLVAAALVLGIIALSGPAWRRELPPFVEDKAPLMVVLAVTSSMNRPDVAPSRLERAKQKIGDLLAARSGARTGLVAYAGSAHLVMPLTDDRAVIAPFLAALDPTLMPAPGRNVTAAVAVAAGALAAETVAGTLLIVADDLDVDDAALRRAAGRNAIVVLNVVPSAADVSVAAGLRSDTVRVSVDASDIQSLERRIESRFQAAQADTFGTRWRDDGYWLLLPASLICLVWFRRGTTVQWVVVLWLLVNAAPGHAQDSHKQVSWFRDLWLTPDQQGRLAFDRGDYRAAKTLFTDPMWRGIAAYRAYDFIAAAEAFGKVDTMEGRFWLGNAQAQNHAYEKAIKIYDEVLKAQPDHAAAKTNRAIVAAALRKQEDARRKKEQGETPPDLPPDDTKVDPDQKGGERVQVKPQDVTTTGAAEAWMRAVQTSPADFLKLKFAIQANSERAGEPKQ